MKSVELNCAKLVCMRQEHIQPLILPTSSVLSSYLHVAVNTTRSCFPSVQRSLVETSPRTTDVFNISFSVTFTDRNQPNHALMANVILGECANTALVRIIMQIISVRLSPLEDPVGHASDVFVEST